MPAGASLSEAAKNCKVIRDGARRYLPCRLGQWVLCGRLDPDLPLGFARRGTATRRNAARAMVFPARIVSRSRVAFATGRRLTTTWLLPFLTVLR